MYAAQYDHLPLLKMLVEHGAEVFHKAQVSRLLKGAQKLMQHLTHGPNFVHRLQPLPFMLLHMVDPLSVLSTCCLSLERMIL